MARVWPTLMWSDCFMEKRGCLRRPVYSGPPAGRRGKKLPLEILAEVDAAHGFVGRDRVGRALGDDLAGIEDVGALADLQHLAHVVVGDQHADAALAQVR